MKLEAITPLIRHLLQVIAGILVAEGYINEEIAVGITGLGVSVISFVWYRYSKSKAALDKEL